MNRNKVFDDLATHGGTAGREDGEFLWYPMLYDYFANKTLLNVGTGVSRIKERTAHWGTKVTTHEACVDIPADIYGDLANVASKSFQTVTCFDVIEHVKEYGRLAFEMARIASETLIVTTPGFEVTQCKNPCHWHEFMPDEIYQLMCATGMRFFKALGTSGDSFPAQTDPYREYSVEEIRGNIRVHPIGLIFKW